MDQFLIPMGKEAYLILNGELDREWLAQELADKEDIYCTDGAYNQFKNGSLSVKAVIGDMDSLERKLVEGTELIHLPSQQQTDFEKALQIMESKYDTVNIYGAEGRDVDHFLGNLSTAMKFKDKVELFFWNPRQSYFFAKESIRLDGVRGKTISVMPFPIVRGLSYKGMKYPLENAGLKLGGKTGIRNEAVEDYVEISHDEGCALVFVEL